MPRLLLGLMDERLCLWDGRTVVQRDMVTLDAVMDALRPYVDEKFDADGDESTLELDVARDVLDIERTKAGPMVKDTCRHISKWMKP